MLSSLITLCLLNLTSLRMVTLLAFLFYLEEKCETENLSILSTFTYLTVGGTRVLNSGNLMLDPTLLYYVIGPQGVNSPLR